MIDLSCKTIEELEEDLMFWIKFGFPDEAEAALNELKKRFCRGDAIGSPKGNDEHIPAES
jgi:hypothetical protein